jgi:hypothetical protein
MCDKKYNALEEIAFTMPKENAGAGTSLRFEYQMNWGLNKLLELENSGDDYVIAFDYHDDIIIFDKEIDATTVDFYQIKTKKNGEWGLREIYNPNVEEDESEKSSEDESERIEEKEKPSKCGDKTAKDGSKKLSYMAKLLAHSLQIKSSRNFYFVTNRQFKPYGFKKSPSGKELSFDDIDLKFQEKIKKALLAEETKLDVEEHIKRFRLRVE